MPTHYTVKEAARLTGRSTSSIRRIIYPIIDDDQHPDRPHVEPSAEDVLALRIKGENFAWRISQELLDRVAPPKPVAESDAQGSLREEGIDPSLRELIALLREQLQQSHQQLAVKDQQIATLSEITKSLNERLHEGNILIGTWQRQLPVPGDKPSATDAKDTAAASKRRAAKTPAAKTPAAKPTKPTKSAGKEPPKRGFFGRLFR